MTNEQAEILGWFCHMLQAASGDGGKKRAAGLKPGWKVDPSHEGAIFSHLTKWKRGEKRDADSGAHPLVHAAWRCLAIAYQETKGEDAEPIEPRRALPIIEAVERFKRELREANPKWFKDLAVSSEHDGVAKELDRIGYKGGRVTD